MKTRYWVLRQNARTYEVSGDGDDGPSLAFYDNDVVMEQVVPDGEVFDPPPWVRHGIDTKGWRIVSKEITESGLVYHGHADWRSIADALAAALESDDGDQATKALDDYRIAVAEVALAQPEQGD